jgi:lipoyl(octanoyl) transferase
MVIDDPVPRAGALNMAIDEVLMGTASSAMLRFYRWSEPSVSFGYFDTFEEAQSFADGRSLVRRWTGGGIVPHGDDLTYSIVIGANEPAYRLSSPEVYRRIHEAIAAALLANGVRAVVASQPAPRISAACFANPVAADLLLEGRGKIAGAAHRRTRRGLLHQGSIQREHLGGEFRSGVASALSEQVEEYQLGGAFLREAENLATEKYASESWLRRR